MRLLLAAGRRCALPALTVVLVLGAARTASAQYTYTKIMYPGAVWTEVAGINDAGQVVGTYTDSTGLVHGFMFHNGTYTTMNVPGMSHNYVFGINDSGTIVGSVSEILPRGPYHGSLFENGAWSTFDFPGQESDGRAINSFGHVAGIYNAGYGTPDHGFLKIGDEYTSIDYPGASITYAFGINDAGYITGTYRDALGRLRGFLYFNGSYSTIAFPGATETYVGGINNANAIVGWKVEGAKVGSFVLTGGKYRPVIVPFPAATNTRARAINDLGMIVGTYTNAQECQSGCAFLATPSTTVPGPCHQTVGMTYENGTLDMQFTLRNTVATTWSSWLVVQNVPFQLWSLPLPIVNPQASVNVPVQLPPLGNVLLASFLSTPAHGTICVDFTSLDMGVAGGS